MNASGIDRADIRSHNSPTVVRSPVDGTRLAVVNRIDTPLYSCAMHMSSDGGTTWTDVDIPFPSGEEAPPRCFAPDAAFGPDGTLYVSFVTLKGTGNVPNATWITSAGRGGTTLSRPVLVSGPLAFQVRLTADATRPGSLYLTWLQASDTATLGFPSTGHPIVLTHSSNGGSSWTEPVRVSAPSRARVVAPTAAVVADGRLSVLYLDVGADVLDYSGAHQGQGGPPYGGPWALVLARSADRGQSWHDTVVEPALVPTERFVAFFPPAPSLAVDRGGRMVYAAFHDGGFGDPDVKVWASDDGGASFGPPVRVNDNRRSDGTAQYLPALATAPDGRLDVVYYDRRADRDNVENEVSLQSSDDQGQTFGPRLRLSDRAFDSRIGLGSERGMPDLGSRLGLVSTDDRAVAVWSDTRAGTEASGKQDLARAIVAISPPSRWRPLRPLGLALVLGGVLLVTWWVARRRVVTAP